MRWRAQQAHEAEPTGTRAAEGGSLVRTPFGSFELTRGMEWRIALAIALVACVVYVFTSPAKATPFNYYSRLADAFLNGRYWLTSAPTWLNELVPVDGRWYVVYPPMPAVLLVPIVAIFGTSFPEQLAGAVFGAIGVGLMWIVLGRFTLDFRARVGLIAVFGFGTVLWYASETGGAWLMAHSVAVMFATAALIPALDRRWPLLVGFLLGCATLARLPIGLTAPFYLAVLLDLGWPPRIPANKRRAIATILLFGIGLGGMVALDELYNFVRWGTPADVGYQLIPGIQDDQFYEFGILSVLYIPRHIHAIFLRGWDFVDKAPFIRPSMWGLGLFMTTPLFLWLAKVRLSERSFWALVGIACALPPIILHGNVGIVQFGYRFSLDLQPMLFVILATVFERGWSRLAWVASGLSVAICAYAVWAIGIGFFAF